VGGKDNTPKLLAPRQRRGSTILVWIERLALVVGLLLVTFYGAARLESWLASRAALRRFAAANAGHDSDDARSGNIVGDCAPGSGQLELPDVDFSLWGEQRIKAYKRDTQKPSGISLAVFGFQEFDLRLRFSMARTNSR
jgi:hypothetical protein